MEESLIYSELESKRFGMNIYRGVQKDPDIKSLKALILDKRVDLTILRTGSENSSMISKMDRIGFPYLQADTLVIYSIDLLKDNPTSLRNPDLEFSIVGEDDSDLLATLVRSTFNEYSNHYSVNSYLNRTLILEGYVEWINSFITDSQKKCFIVRRDNDIVAFAGIKISGDVSEGILYGVHPSFSGGGVYTDLIRYTKEYCKRNNARTMTVSTQIQNYAVQKVWIREGFLIQNAYSTFHINSMLSVSYLPILRLSINISKAEIEQYGNVSKDLNPIHFDDVYAQSRGFKSRIVHGLTLNAILSNQYGNKFPGNGTAIVSFRYLFLQPVYPDSDYQCEITFPFYDKRTSMYHSTAKFLDQQGGVVLVAYTVLNKSGVGNK